MRAWIPAVVALAACGPEPENRPEPEPGDTGCTPRTWYPDLDGDGYGAGTSVSQCRAPCGYVADATDCDDSDRSVHPGAVEVPYDGVDQDCDPGTSDDDGDGDGVPLGDDCDDEDASVFPGAKEICGNGADDDCDGCASACDLAGPVPICDADFLIAGTSTGGNGRAAEFGASDLDGDGLDDLVVGAGAETARSGGAGGVWVFRSPVATSALVTGADAFLVGEATGDSAGSSVAPLGDADGDGIDDLLVGAPGSDRAGPGTGAAYLVLGPVDHDLSLADVAGVVEGTGGFPVGGRVAAAGDTDDDGLADLLLSSYGVARAWLFRGPLAGPVSVTGAEATLVGNPGSYAGWSVAGAGDIDADGSDDVLVGILGTWADIEGGEVALLYGPITGSTRLDHADARLQAGGGVDDLGSSVDGAGDLDGDGYDDFVVGGEESDLGAGDDSGAAWVVFGPVLGTAPVADVAGATLAGRNPGAHAGVHVRGLGDMDGDGARDLVISAYTDDEGGEDSGTVYVEYGPFSGTRTLGDSGARILGGYGWVTGVGWGGDIAGSMIAAGGDLDGDGRGDLSVGSANADGEEPEVGTSAIFLSGSWS